MSSGGYKVTGITQNGVNLTVTTEDRKNALVHVQAFSKSSIISTVQVEHRGKIYAGPALEHLP